MKKNYKILIIRLSALGDTIHTLPLAAALKRENSSCEIGWIVEDKAHQFVKNNPLVDKTYILPRKKWKKRGFSIKNIVEFFCIIRKIKKENYDIVIDTQQLLKSSIIMPFLGIKRKLTHNDGREFSWIFANEFVKSTRKQFDIKYHVVRRNLEFAEYLGIKDLSIEFKLPEVTIDSIKKVDAIYAKFNPHKKILVLAPATTWENKHWNKKNWAKLIDEFADSTNLVITGSAADKKLNTEIIEMATKKNIFDISGKTNLLELSEVYKRSDVVVSPDSGSAHIAWATGKPYVITVFCATSAERTAPFGEKYLSFSPNIECTPCMKKKCSNKKSPLLCTNVINSAEIVTTLKKVLQ